MKFLVLAFAVLLTGCAVQSPTVTKLYPPSALLEDCKAGSMSFGTTEDTEQAVLSLAAALKLCNIDKQKLREWAND